MFTGDFRFIEDQISPVEVVRYVLLPQMKRNELSIIEVTNKAGPLLVSRIDKAYFKFIHEGWLTEDNKFFIMEDEGRKGGTKT